MGSAKMEACLAVEIEDRTARGRQIVGRQRELTASLGEAPLAVALLAAFEKSLAILENMHVQRPADACHLGLETPSTEEQQRELMRLMEILRSGGYHCELTKEITH